MPGIDKVLEKVGRTLETGAFYEAQQMYKTIFHRYRARKQLGDSYELLKGAAIQQLHNKQVTCGVELGLLLVEAYIADHVHAIPSRVQPLLDIIAAFPKAASEESVELEEYGRLIAAALKWANQAATGAAGGAAAAGAVHDAYAQYLSQTFGWKQLGRASVHYARGNDSQAFAAALHEASCSSSSQEEDLFVARAMLQVLASASRASSGRQLQHAQQLLEVYQQQWGLPDTPLTNFSKLLLQALHKHSMPLFRMLKQTYAVALEQDPSFGSFLDKVASTYLSSSTAGQQPLGGLFGSLLRSFTELEGEDE